MQTYRVGVWEERGGYIEVEANSAQEAEEKALERGLDEKADITHGDSGIADISTIN